MNTRLLGLSLLFLGVLISCELYEQDDYVEQVFVESYMTALEPLPEVRISRTASAFEFYTFEDFALPNANVQIHLLNDAGIAEETFIYRMDTVGVYIPDGFDDVRVLPMREYLLDITFTDREEHLRAKAFVPDTFRVVRSVRDTTTYQAFEQLEFDFSLSQYPGRQNIYIFSTLALDPENNDSPPIWNNFDDEPPVIASSGLINQDNYQVNPDNTITLTFPWIGIAYFGPNQITAYAVDDNIYDFLRSQSVQLGGSTLSPGEIQNVFYNIEGGIGLFGAMSGASVQVYVKAPF